jgi:prophage regulatory protein
MDDNFPAFLRLPAVCTVRGRSRSSTYNDVKDQLLTEPVRIGAGAVAWPASEIRAINCARIAGKTDDEIRALVRALHAARKEAA